MTDQEISKYLTEYKRILRYIGNVKKVTPSTQVLIKQSLNVVVIYVLHLLLLLITIQLCNLIRAFITVDYLK